MSSLWYCPKCGALMNNSVICRFGCGETMRVTYIDTNGGKDLIDLRQERDELREELGQLAHLMDGVVAGGYTPDHLTTLPAYRILWGETDKSVN